MLDISTWTLQKDPPLEPKDLPKSFLQNLWLLCPDARSTCCKPANQTLDGSDNQEMLNGFEERQCPINPLDLVTAVFMSANTFLQQEMVARMVQCQFAVPLVLPHIHAEEPSSFLLWPLRGAVGQWRSHSLGESQTVQEDLLASTSMPMVSCMKLGSFSISKSQVLNSVIRGQRSQSETFVHRGMDGGQLPRRLANGLVDIGWCLPKGEPDRDVFSVPLAVANLRGDASLHEKCLSLLCLASSVVVVFCGNLREKDKEILAFCKDMACKLILIDLSETENNENRVVGFVGQNLKEDLSVPEGSILQGRGLNEEGLATILCDTLRELVPNQLKSVTLEATATLALEVGFNVDEGVVCKRAMATAEEVLKGLNEGSAVFRQKQLPLQGALWSRLSEIEKNEMKQSQEGKEMDPQLKIEKNDILARVRNYKMTPAMKIFTDALFKTDVTERTYFLSWMRMRLVMIGMEKQNAPQNQFTNQQTNGSTPQYSANDELQDSDSFDTDSDEEETAEGSMSNDLQVSEQQSAPRQDLMSGDKSPEQRHNGHQTVHSLSVKQNGTHLQTFEPDLSLLGLEHFLREMGLIFELTHIDPGSGSHNVLRLPSIAADLILYGVPLELMDGDASNIPVRWLGCVFAEMKRRLPQERSRTRTLISFGGGHAKSAEVLSSLFGVKFFDGRVRSTRGVHMVALSPPANLREVMECDLLLLIDVEGICSSPPDNTKNTHVLDNEMAAFATGISDVLVQNISSQAGSDFETSLTVTVNALLLACECGSVPTYRILSHDDGIYSILQAMQLKRVADVLQAKTKDSGTSSSVETAASFKGPWCCMPASVDTHYSESLLKLKQNLFGALKTRAAHSPSLGLPEFMGHLCAVWDTVRAKSTGVHSTDLALAFSELCTEISQWEENLLEHMESWMVGATERIYATETLSENDLSVLKDLAKEEVQIEMMKLRSNVEAKFLSDGYLNTNIETFKPILLANMDDLQERVSEAMIERLEEVKENYSASSQMKKFENLLEKEQESKLHDLVEKSKSNDCLFQDPELEEEFGDVWTKTLSKFDFRASETDDITARVADILRQNIVNRGLQKHLKKLDVIGPTQTTAFQVYDEHFGYRSRLKHMFEDNNRLQRVEAQQLASRIIEQYHQFVADKSGLLADFSDSYITELLESVEQALKEKSMEIRSAFEVDIKVYLCNAACRDFQILHNRYAKDRELLTCINSTKGKFLAHFIYQFRKRDQCQRLAHAFISMVVKPTLLDYVYTPLGMNIVEEIKGKGQQYVSQQAFHKSLLAELIKEDRFESFIEYLVSYDSFRMRMTQAAVIAHLSESTSLDKWRQERLGEIVGKFAAAVSKMSEGTNGVLSNTKPLLERVCLTVEEDGDVNVPWGSLSGPLFSVTTEWNRFITCLMELLAAMRLQLAQEFSQKVDFDKLLQCLPLNPADYLLKKLGGCGALCPVCGAPCDVEEMGHDIHRSLLHRPKGVLPSQLPSSVGSPESTTHTDIQDASVACTDLADLHPDWSIASKDRTPSVYWRYRSFTITVVVTRYNTDCIEVCMLY